MNRLTPEMRAALHAAQGGPIEFQDEQTSRVYFLIESTSLGSVSREHEDKVLEGIAAAERGEVAQFDVSRIRSLVTQRQKKESNQN
ncbi:MAG: hypothetical protein AAF497_01120 [Planctomycetota bacterium]